MNDALTRLSQLAPKEKPSAYSELVSRLISAANQSTSWSSDDVGRLVQTVITDEHAGLVVGKQVVGDLVKRLGEITDSNVRAEFIRSILSVLQTASVGYEEQVGVSD